MPRRGPSDATKHAQAVQAARRMISRDERPSYQLTALPDGSWGAIGLPGVTVAAAARRDALTGAVLTIAAVLEVPADAFDLDSARCRLGPMSAAASRAGRLHIPVVNLVVPQRWQVGRVVFEPPGTLERLVKQRQPQDPTETMFSEFTLEGIQKHQASTAAVPVHWPDDSKGQKAERDRAVEEVRDALSALRLLKNSRYRIRGDMQEFGLHGDISSVLQRTTVTRGRRIIYTGVELIGIVGDWTFRTEDLELFQSDKRFAFLDAALRRRVRRTELERRILTALRVRAMSTAMLRPQLQVILLATALEALLGEEVPAGERREHGAFFRIAQRASYLFCGEPDHRYPSRRPCLYLHAKSEAAMRRAFEDRVKRGEDPRCSAFWHVFGLLEDRNEALHLARETFDKGLLSWHGVTTDEVILYALDWATTRGARRLSELDSDLNAFVAGGKALPID